MNLAQVKELNDAAFNELESFRAMMFDIYSLCIPTKNNWQAQYSIASGQRKDLIVYNSYPVTATKQFAATLVSLIAPNGTKFFELGVGNKLDLNESQTIKQQLAPISDVIFQQLNDSNFYEALNESFIDLAAGSGGLLINYDSQADELFFKSLDMSRVAFLEDKRGIINYVFRHIGTLDKQTQQRLYPEINFNSEVVDLIESVVIENNRFVYRLTDSTYAKVYKEAQSNANPFVIFRWSKMANENRGRGILTDLLGLIKMTNTMAADVIRAAAKVIDPPYLSDDADFLNKNNTKFRPNGIITIPKGTLFQQLPTTANLPFAFQEIQNNNNVISEAMMINILGQVGAGQLTATEVTARLQLASQVLGAFYSRVQKELLTPLFNRVIELLENSLQIPLITLDVASGQTRKLRFKYSSPIININKQIGVQKLLQSVQAVAEVTGQQAQQYIEAAFKVNKIPFFIADSLGTDMSLVNNDAEVMANLQQAAQNNALQQLLALQAANPALGQAPVQTGLAGTSIGNVPER